MKMNDQRDGLPVRRYEYVNHHILDSNRWNQFTHRPGDIIISTSYKAGTTWMQTIVANLVFQDGAMPQPVLLMSPWLDMRHRPLDAALVNLDGQTHRRFIKSHLPLDALPYYPAARYIIVGRDPRDVFMSLLAHHGNYTAEAIAQFNSVSVEIGREFPVDLGEASHAWRNWLTRGSFSWESDGYPYWSHLRHFQSWWEFRHLPNIYLVHYGKILEDPEKEIRSVAEFLGIAIDEALLPGILERISFATMKRDFNEKINPRSPEMFRGGGATFMNKGSNGRWRDRLGDADMDVYAAAKERTMTPDAVSWLEQGD